MNLDLTFLSLLLRLPCMSRFLSSLTWDNYESGPHFPEFAPLIAMYEKIPLGPGTVIYMGLTFLSFPEFVPQVALY